MKTAKETKVNNRTRTVIECSECGRTTYVIGKIDTTKAKAAIERSCRTCSPPKRVPINEGWWKEFGLDKNPYVYVPMPRLRTGQRLRIEEARRMGWMAWTWNDEYKEERKALNQSA